MQGVLNGVDDKPEGFDGNTDALLAAKAQAKQQLQIACQLSVCPPCNSSPRYCSLQRAQKQWQEVRQPWC